MEERTIAKEVEEGTETARNTTIDDRRKKVEVEIDK
jgi:hypothetical protein